MTTATKTTTRTSEPTPEEQLKRCECGCGQIVNPKRHFVPGHDQRYKGILLRRFDGGDERAAVELMERGWKSNDELETRADKRETAAKEKADRAAKRELDRTAREAAKAAKPKRETQSSRTAAAGRRLAAEQKAREEAAA